jgi:hypothetical protein
MASTGRLSPTLSRGGIFSKSLNKGGQFSGFTIMYTTPAPPGGFQTAWARGSNVLVMRANKRTPTP